MYELDKKNKKILYQLELDSRQSYTQIAKKTKLSREVITYRINKLEKDGVIDKYAILLNAKKMGYETYKCFFQLQNVDTEKFKEIIKEFQKHPFCVWMSTCAGKWDLTIVFFAKTSLNFREYREHFLAKFSKYIRDQTFTIELDIYHFKKKYLGEDKLSLYKIPYLGGEMSQEILNLEDIKVLTYLCETPRISLVELSQKTKLSIDIIRSRIKKLTKNGIIQGSRVHINTSKLGLISFKVFFNVKSTPETDKLTNYLGQLKSVWDVMHCLGNWNLEVNFDVENAKEFHNIIMDLKNKFPDVIQSYDFVQMFDNYKYNFFPMGKFLMKKLIV